MSLATSLVDIANIASSITRSSFSEVDLDRLAKLILDAGGLVKPLVLKRTDVDRFEVANGDLEYYAAVRASEMDSDYEMVRAFIIEPSNEKSIKEQLQILNEKVKPNGKPSPYKESASERGDSNSVELKVRQDNLELRLDRWISEQGQIKQALEKKIQEIENQISKPNIPLLEALNTSNIRELSIRLKSSNINSKIIEKIVSERKENGDFLSFDDVVKRIKGFGAASMLKIIDNCL